MKVGDILVFKSDRKKSVEYDFPYTNGKYYKIFKIENMGSIGRCGWIRDDHGGAVYFPENEAEDENWYFLNKNRKKKLEQLKKKI